MNAVRSAGDTALSATFYVAEAIAVMLCALLMACVILVSFVVRELARATERRRARAFGRPTRMAHSTSH